MKLIRTSKFTKQTSKLIKNNSFLRDKLLEALTKLSENPFDSSLFTHKLKGSLEGNYAARITFELRIVFRIIKQGNEECILLLTIGTHDEVY
jgi:mRNA interferase YafQ